MHLLVYDVIQSLQHDQEFCLRFDQVRFGLLPEWALGRDRMHQRPTQREERNEFPFEFERVEHALAFAIRRLEARHGQAGLDFDDFVAQAVGESAHQAPTAVEWRDQHVAAREDFVVGSREAGEQQAGDQCGGQ